MYSVCCKSWGDGIEVSTPEEVLKFIAESSVYPEDIVWFTEHLKEVTMTGYLEHGDIEVEYYK